MNDYWRRPHFGHPYRTLPPCSVEEREKRYYRMLAEGIKAEHVPLRRRVHKVESYAEANLWRLTVIREDLGGMEFAVTTFNCCTITTTSFLHSLQGTFHRASTGLNLEQFDLWLHNFRQQVIARIRAARSGLLMPIDRSDHEMTYPDHYLTRRDARRMNRKLDKFLSRLPRARRIMLEADLAYAGLED